MRRRACCNLAHWAQQSVPCRCKRAVSVRVVGPTRREPGQDGQQVGLDRVLDRRELVGPDPGPAEELVALHRCQVGRREIGGGRHPAEEEPLVGDEPTATPEASRPTIVGSGSIVGSPEGPSPRATREAPSRTASPGLDTAARRLPRAGGRRAGHASASAVVDRLVRSRAPAKRAGIPGPETAHRGRSGRSPHRSRRPYGDWTAETLALVRCCAGSVGRRASTAGPGILGGARPTDPAYDAATDPLPTGRRGVTTEEI